MSRLRKWTGELTACLQTVKSRSLRWQLRTHADRMRLKTARALAEQELAGKLKKQQLALERELALLKTQHKAELARLRIKNKQELKDYREYLASLDQLKAAIVGQYRHQPEALAFTIHHHAKQLLNQMWEAEDLQQKISSELQLIRFMSSIHDDIQAVSNTCADAEALPVKTLALLHTQRD